MDVKEECVVVARIPELIKEVPNLVGTRKEICFHDQLVVSNMKIVEHLIMDDKIVGYEDLHMDEDLHSYVVAEMIKDVPVFMDMFDMDV